MQRYDITVEVPVGGGVTRLEAFIVNAWSFDHARQQVAAEAIKKYGSARIVNWRKAPKEKI
jgi:hypothetical protein